MQHQQSRTIWTASAVLFAVLVMVSGVIAQISDGRINEVAHAGGNVLYCWDDNGLVTTDYSTGRIVALSPDGQLLLDADGAELARLVALAESGELAETQRVTTATDRFGTGEISLWVRTTGQFMLTGTDEHGKAFDFQWRGCQPVTAPADEEPEETELPAEPTEPPPVDPCEENPEAEGCIESPLPPPPPCIECELPCVGEGCDEPQPLCFDGATFVECDDPGLL